ncbi:MAG: hypothetical protein HY075_04815 [Deltaproteobacteria bacterium]|nr:hypothetical protein [Deltaproteobacteria bacterium]
MRQIATVCRNGLLGISLFLLQFCRALWRRPREVTIALVLFTLLCTVSLTRIRFLFSAQDMIGEGIPSADELPDLKERYEDGVTSILFLVPPEGRFSFTPDELCAIRRWYSITRVSSQVLKNTASTFDVKWPVRVGPNRIKYQNMLQLDCDTKTPAHPLSDVKTSLDGSPWAALKDRKNRLSLIFNFTFKDALNSNFGSFDPRAVTPLRETVETDLKKVVPTAKLFWVGLADYQWYVRKGFQFSMIVNTLMVLFLLVSVRWLYGTWIAGLIFCVTLVVNGIWIYGTKGMLGSAYDVLSSGLFLILGVSSIEDFTFLSSEQLKGASWKTATRRLMVPAFFTSLTTMIGFISLCTSDLAIIRRFGVWCAVGSLLEWLMLFAFLPIFLDRFYKKRSWVDARRARAGRIDAWGVKALPLLVCLLGVAVFPLAPAAFSRLSVNDDPARIFPKAHPYNAGLDELRESKGWQGTASLIWDAPSSSTRLDEIANRLKASGTNVVDFESPEQAVSWLAKPNLMPRELITDDFKLSLQYKQLVDPDGVTRALLYLRDTSVEALRKLKSDVEALCPNHECHAAGDLIAYSDFSTMVPKTLIDSMIASLVLVALTIAFLAFAFDKPGLTPYLLASSFWGPCLMVCLLAFLGIPMDFMKCIIASVLVGLTGDNAIQYLFAAGKDDLRSGLRHRGGASIVTNILMAGTALMYLLSYFRPPKTFGLLLASGLVAALVGDLWFLTGLLDLREFLNRKFFGPRRRT